MATVYHTSETPTVAIDRLCDELRRRAETLGTTMLQIGHRALAAAIGCSASRIPALMQRLEDAGSIIRQPFKNAYLIDVAPLIDQPQPPDRSAPSDDATPLIDQPPADLVLAQPDAADRQHNRDRVKTGCMVDLDSKSQEKEIARPLFERLLAQPGMSRSLALKMASSPIGTLAEFEADLRLAQSIAGIYSPFYFTVSRWQHGQRVEAPEEAQHAPQPTPSTSRSEHRSRRDPQRGRRAERPGARGRAAGASHVDPSVYAAILAGAVPLDIDDV